MFDIRYQIRLNDLYDFTTTSVTFYWQTMTHIRLLDMLFNGEAPIRFTRLNQRLFIDWDWSDSALGVALAGQYIVVDCYMVVDPNQFTNVYNDWWLKKFATVQVKKLWGTNLKKYSGVQLLGGVTLNGKEIYDESMTEEVNLMEIVQNGLSGPPEFLVG